MRLNPKYYLTLSPGLILFTVLWLRSLLSSTPLSTPGFINNPDAYVRLEHIRQWLESGDWFHRVLSRVGTEDHVILHWTRPLDILYAPFMWLTDNVLYTGVWLSLPLGLVALIIASRLVSIDGERRLSVIGLGTLFIAALPYFLFTYIPQGAPDHHGLMMVLFIASILLAYRLINDAPTAPAWGLGLVQGIALWTSSESLVAIATIHVSLGIAWMIYGTHQLPRLAAQASISLTLTITVALIIEYGFEPPISALDRLSLFSLAIAFAVLIVWGLIRISQTRLITPALRAMGAMVFGIAILCVLIILNPNTVDGPMSGTDTWFLNTWITVYNDGFSLPAIGGVIICITALSLGYWQRHTSHTWLFLSPIIIVFCLLGWASSTRWMVYGEIASIPLILSGFVALWDKLADRPGIMAMIGRVFTPVILLGLASTDAIVLGLTTSQTEKASLSENQTCDIAPAITQLNTLYETHGQLMVLAHANITPAILFHTQHRVSAVPIHPNAKAVRASVDTLISTKSEFNLKRHAIVVCQAELASGVYGTDPSSLHMRLLSGDKVSGLTPISKNAGGYAIYLSTP